MQVREVLGGVGGMLRVHGSCEPAAQHCWTHSEQCNACGTTSSAGHVTQ
jgi:hypothetical protein